MKNNYVRSLLLLCLLVGTQLHAQEATSDDQFGVSNRKSEIRLDVFDAAFFSALDFSYERVGDSAIGYGASLFVNLRDTEDDLAYYEKISFTPFVRFYFFNKQDYGAKGLFAEVFTKFASGDDPNNSQSDYFDTAVGVAIGQKWVNKRGFILEISFGGGRNIGFDNQSPEATFRGGISLGYRF